MPELPDVEGFRRLFADRAAGRRVERAHAPAPDVLRNTTPQGLGRALRHRRFAPPHRHGKWLLTPTQRGAALSGRGVLKSALLAQERVAGPGNVVADEVCWRARVHPRRGLRTLTDDEHARVHGALRGVLSDAVPEGRVPPRQDWLTGVRDDVEPVCPRCRMALAHGEVAGRSTWWCPEEQRLD